MLNGIPIVEERSDLYHGFRFIVISLTTLSMMAMG